MCQNNWKGTKDKVKQAQRAATENLVPGGPRDFFYKILHFSIFIEYKHLSGCRVKKLSHEVDPRLFACSTSCFSPSALTLSTYMITLHLFPQCTRLTSTIARAPEILHFPALSALPSSHISFSAGLPYQLGFWFRSGFPYQVPISTRIFVQISVPISGSHVNSDFDPYSMNSSSYHCI